MCIFLVIGCVSFGLIRVQCSQILEFFFAGIMRERDFKIESTIGERVIRVVFTILNLIGV
jgi:hypothetical protein